MDTVTVRSATTTDLGWVKRMADRHRVEVGFVLRPALAEAIERLRGLGAGNVSEGVRRVLAFYRTPPRWVTLTGPDDEPPLHAS